MQTAVFGAKGRLGSLIVNGIEAAGHRVLQFDSEDSSKGLSNLGKPALIVDVTGDKGTASLATNLLNQIHFLKDTVYLLIVGSTGHSDSTKALLDEVSGHLPVCMVSNFSLGVTLFEQMLLAKTKSGKSVANLARSFGFDFGLVETHHRQKLDAPSGTAKTLAKAFGIEFKDIASVRLGHVVGEHTLTLAREGEEIRIQHIAHERRLFADGAVALINAVIKNREFTDLKPGYYDKESFLLL